MFNSFPCFTCFNPHFRKGSDNRQIMIGDGTSGFNPHFRKGSDTVALLIDAILRVSIHTSAREVTPFILIFHNVSRVSIHTSAREVTGSAPGIQRSVHRFNPHFRKGSDDHPARSPFHLTVSIHTSAREVTAIFRKKLFQFL